MSIPVDGINYVIISSKKVSIGTGKAVDNDVQGDGVFDSSVLDSHFTIKS